MENKKNKKIITTMWVISLIIVVMGFVCGVSFYYEITNQMANSGSGLYMNGTDYSGILNMFGQAGALVISVLIVVASFFAVLVQWIGYFIVKFIKNKVVNSNQPQMYMNNDNNI